MKITSVKDIGGKAIVGPPEAYGPPSSHRALSEPGDASDPQHDARRLLFLVITATAILFVVFGLTMRRNNAVLEPGAPAPDFELETFDGDIIRLTDFRGQVVILNFWASWCVECALEAEELEALWQDYQDKGVVLLGIGYTDTRPAALGYIEQYGITYPNGPDRADRISRQYRLTGVPETVVIDKAGQIVPLPNAAGPPTAKIVGQVGAGGQIDAAGLRRLIDDLLVDTAAMTDG
jgi:cytochrome c biogenesis protein CcmG/thiol:disulfide interchange protein DsbE